MRHVLAVFLVAVPLVVACEADVEVLPGSGPGGDVGQPIYGGDDATRPYHAAVVALHQVQSGSIYVSPFCTGTLIAPDVVLTAAHCMDVASGGPSFKVRAPSAVAISVGNDPVGTYQVSADAFLATVTPASETSIYSGYSRRTLRNDIALIRLAEPVEGVTPVPALTQAKGAITPARPSTSPASATPRTARTA